MNNSKYVKKGEKFKVEKTKNLRIRRKQTKGRTKSEETKEIITGIVDTTMEFRRISRQISD